MEFEVGYHQNVAVNLGKKPNVFWDFFNVLLAGKGRPA